MSITSITTPVRIEIWMKAGGRCEYHGCNKALWRDELTMREMNIAYLAHIVADSPDGPRGDPILSESLKNDFSNIMLLCDVHHRMIDKADVIGHSVELLHAYKAHHEERIERLTEMQDQVRTEVVRFASRIRNRPPFVTSDQAQAAVSPERYPATERGIPIDLSDLEFDEQDPEYWEAAKLVIERKLARAIADGEGPGGHPLSHLSVFALAPIPLLVHFGKHLGDVIPADVYQRHRNPDDWSWRELEDDGFTYETIRPQLQVPPGQAVAVCLSLSGAIHMAEVDQALCLPLPTYVITIPNPRRDFLHAKEQLELFRVEWMQLLAEIRVKHGADVEIHLFPAVPNSVAVELGRSLLPKSDPSIIIYDHDRENGGFRRIMSI